MHLRAEQVIHSTQQAYNTILVQNNKYSISTLNDQHDHYLPVTCINLNMLGTIDLSNQSPICSFPYNLNPHAPYFKQELYLHNTSTGFYKFTYKAMTFEVSVPLESYFNTLNSNNQLSTSLQQHINCINHSYTQINNYPNINLLRLSNFIGINTYLPHPRLISILLTVNLTLKQIVRLRSSAEWHQLLLSYDLSSRNRIYLINLKNILLWPLGEAIFCINTKNKVDYYLLDSHSILKLILAYLSKSNKTEVLEF